MNRLVKVYTSTLCCEAILRKLGNGDYIIVSQCGGEKEPDIENRIYLFRSIDAGKTWGAPVALYEDGSAVYQTEVSIIGNKICMLLDFNLTKVPSIGVLLSAYHLQFSLKH